ncbi:NAD-dependent succinate-semialdehyde dehydrogenase [Vibrio caribbeanicus]|uniref:Succinate-semialdehyde dehydrogenase n=1 Tax=Vibrio caribbeanicus ATCC BAA-2122 TaxID=796620 RepID=E3BH21_9VIBR|nr:NAD-dependent succinate-semialdehyde dehydrogenase [Vibrio caribbeanicus]EFP97658.1 succinate-semialdehyde dehydrogenase [Vibrio caribbeanicus ATCC BAA-2122]
MKAIVNRTLTAILQESEQASGIRVDNPATGECLGFVPTLSTTQIYQVIEQSHQGQTEWNAKPIKERCGILKKWHQLVIENQEDLSRLITLEQGKPLSAAQAEVLYGASFIEWFAEEARRTYGETIPSPNGDRQLMTIRQPIGVASAITPWNFPLAMIARKAAPALAAGCSFIVKPAEKTPLSAYALAELAYQAGVPKDVLQVVLAIEPEEVGKVFTSHPLVRKLSFTGSTRVGKLLMEQSAKDVKRTSMELGGNAPFIVFEDADIDLAVEGAVASKFRNSGQACICSNRFYVHSQVYDEFIAKFSARVATLKVGNGLDKDVVIGPLISLEAKRNIEQLVDGAIAQGAKRVNAPENLDGCFMSPVILEDVKHDMDINRHEIFGPVAPIIRFDSEEQVLKMANDTVYGLACYFYTENINRVWRMSERLDYGMVGINEATISTEVAPFGGVKHSGIGKEGAKQGIDEYMNIKYLCLGRR